MSENDIFSCEYCEKDFDSKRGLHIHQSQVHPDEEKQKVEDREAEDSEETKNPDTDTETDENEEELDLDIEKTEDEFSVKAGKENSTINMSLTTRQVAAASLVVGLIIGGLISGAYLYSTMLA